ncbi:phosphomevalonate kinase [Lederbergia graminis]|uniref:phosphomevalonate kinase n=1 Tax=Lederbergia graminis TaxID=735518 RepID=A0ABW0LI07_9BACI
MYNSYKIKVPGKLFIAGEYAVLEPGNLAIVIAVNRYMETEIKAYKENQLHLPQLGYDSVSWSWKDGELTFHPEGSKLAFIKNAISLFYTLLQENSVEIRPFALSITSELDDVSGKKYGLGSSAAVVVSVISALFHFYQNEKIKPMKENIFKLAAMAHIKTQGNGSCADIAASTFGGWLGFSTFELNWIKKQIEEKVHISTLLSEQWPGLIIKPLTPPEYFNLVVGWTSSEASTAPMVNIVMKLKQEQPSLYDLFLKESKIAVNNLINSFLDDNGKIAIDSLKQNRMALKKLGEHAGVNIETPQLESLIRIANKYGAGKSSGAGGGDCGIAFITDPSLVTPLQNEWQSHGIMPLDIQLSKDGATIEPLLERK